jgi:hypothetical protein
MALNKLSHVANVINLALEAQGYEKRTTPQKFHALASKKNRPEWVQIFPGQGKRLPSGENADLAMIDDADMEKAYEWVVNGSTRSEADVQADAERLLARLNGEEVPDDVEDEDDPDVNLDDEDESEEEEEDDSNAENTSQAA